MNPNKILMSISMWLNDYRRKNKLTSKKIAEDLECSTGYIDCLLAYKKDPEYYGSIGIKDSFIMKLSKTYNVSIDEIFEYDEDYRRTKENNEKLYKIVDLFRNKLIGQQVDIKTIKKELSKITMINNIDVKDNYIDIKIEDLIIGDKITNSIFNQFELALKDNIIVYLILEQSYSTYSIQAQKQRYYFDKENELFVSSVKMEGIPMLFDLNCETMIKYNNNFIYQCRHENVEAAVELNNKIFDEIINGKTIEEIKNEYRNMD